MDNLDTEARRSRGEWVAAGTYAWVMEHSKNYIPSRNGQSVPGYAGGRVTQSCAERVNAQYTPRVERLFGTLREGK